MTSIAQMIFAVAMFLVVLGGSASAAESAPPSASFLDMILLGLVIFLVFRMFKRRSGRWSNPHDDNSEERQDIDRTPPPAQPQDRHEHAKAMWGMLSSPEELSDENAAPSARRTSGAEFDKAEFLEGAKLFYSRFQEAKDSGHWDTVVPFIAPVLLEELQREDGARDGARSEIMLLDASVMDVQTKDGQTAVTVFFDAQVRKGLSGEKQITEKTAWEFVRPEKDLNALWVLEKIDKIDH